MTSANALASVVRPGFGGQPPRYQPMPMQPAQTPQPVQGGNPPQYVGPPQGAPQPGFGANPPGYTPMQLPPIQRQPVGPVAPYQPMQPPMWGGQPPRPQQMQAANNFAQAMQGGW
jgi:hypothetical protein